MKRLLLYLLVFGASMSSCNKEVISYEEQLQKDVAIIDGYLTSHSITATADPSGLRYVVTTVGTGSKPAQDDMVSVKFKGHFLPGGDVFGESDGVSLPLSTLITGWQIVIPKMTKGSTFTVYIPSGLAYGPAGDNTIPPNSNVFFEIELLDDDAKLVEDVAALDAYLTDTLHLSADTIHKDPSGIRYVFSKVGTGPKPVLNGAVTMTYVGKRIPNQTTFVTQSAQERVTINNNIMPGMVIGLPLVPEGSEVSLYFPSGLAYGPSGSDNLNVEPNTNVVFEIKLISAH